MRLCAAIATMILLSACARQKIVVSVHNPSDIERMGEMVEIDASRAVDAFGKSFVVRNADGDEVAWQITHDGLLIFQTDVAPGATVDYTISAGTPAPVDTVTVAIFRPDCQDDLAWENDRAGYRLYGPQFRAGGGKVFGYDLWTKSVTYPILAKRYDDDHKRGISYHVDHGDGFDGYTVGPTLGAGMNALVDASGQICYPCAYQKYELLDNGPLRMTVRFTVDSIGVDSLANVVETRTITLDAGAWLNRTVTSYDVTSAMPIVAGIAIHSDNRDYTIDREKGYISYADYTDNVTAGNGEIYVGVLAETADSIAYSAFPDVRANAVGQLLMYNTYKPGESFTYYWGSAWSKGGVDDIARWNSVMSDEAIKHKYPLEVTVK